MYRIVMLVLAVMIAASPVRAQEIPALCSGKNLLDQLKADDPAAAEEVLAEMKADPNQGPLFWKIEKQGVKPSWLMGTMHVTETRVVTVPERVKKKISDASVMVLEIKDIANKQGLAAKIAGMTRQTQMPDGQTLWDVIPDDQENPIRFNPAVAMLPQAYVERMQPWVLAQSLNTPFCEMLRSSVKFSLDETLAQRAQIANVPIEGLESIEEQINVLSGLAMKDQVEGLVALTKRTVTAEDIYVTMVDMYLSRQVSALMPLMKRLPGLASEMETPAMDQFMLALIDKRNVLMAERAQKFIDKGNAFIAVGALHLPGKDGVVELLREAGYSLTPAE